MTVMLTDLACNTKLLQSYGILNQKTKSKVQLPVGLIIRYQTKRWVIN
jgi:hypothetical protein